MILSKLFIEPSMTISADYKNKNTKSFPNMFYKGILILSLSLGFVNFLKHLKTEGFSNVFFLESVFSHVNIAVLLDDGD